MHFNIRDDSKAAEGQGRGARLDVELFDGDGARLAHAEGAADGLVLQGWVHGRLQDEHMIGRRQVDAHRTAAHAQQEHRRRWIPLECIDRLQQRFTSGSAGDKVCPTLCLTAMWNFFPLDRLHRLTLL